MQLEVLSMPEWEDWFWLSERDSEDLRAIWVRCGIPKGGPSH